MSDLTSQPTPTEGTPMSTTFTDELRQAADTRAWRTTIGPIHPDDAAVTS